MGDDVRADREIVDDILEEVRKAGAEVPETRVNELIERLRVLKRAGPLIGNRTSNREHSARVLITATRRNAPRWQAGNCWSRSKFRCAMALPGALIARSPAYFLR